MRAELFVFIIIIAFIAAVDVPLFLHIRRRIDDYSNTLKVTIKTVFLAIPVLIIPAMWMLFSHVKTTHGPELYVSFANMLGLFMLIYIPKLVFVIVKGIDFFIHSIPVKRKPHETGKPISRSEFMGKMGLAVASIPFASMIYGMARGRYDFYVKHKEIKYENLPEAFDGLNIIQISDIHLGNFNYEYHRLYEVVELINKSNPDLIFMTGDMVNNFAEETNGWAPIFTKMKARIGKYSVLGNHDYGDYSRWSSQHAKNQNLEGIKTAHKRFGFNLMLNTNETLTINGQSISLIGIENWGLPPFPQYGDLEKAKIGVPDEHFKILLSHDPTHWETEIRDHENIDLTLAGHTHGMQLGIKWKDKQWSPAKWKYNYWDGLYNSGNKYLYVNRGLGFIGIPMRIGMPPEITRITLRKA